jgi:protein O-mannosyl-transferase
MALTSEAQGGAPSPHRVRSLAARRNTGDAMGPAPRPSRYGGLVAGLLLFALAALPFWPALRGDFIWDDDAHVTANPTVVGPEGLREIWTTPAANYFPLVLTVFRAIHAAWGLNPLAYHVATLLCHALAAVLLWRVLTRLIAGRESRPPVPEETPAWFRTAPWLGAALWAVHPVQTESVAWISELKNTQSAVFFLAALLFWLKWLCRPAGARGFRAQRHYALALFAGVLALLSKPSTVMLPAALLLCTWWMGPGRTGPGRRRRSAGLLAPVLPFAALSLAAGLWAIWEQKFHQHAIGPEWAQSFGERAEIAGRAVWFYLGKLLWPDPLIFVYPRWSLSGTWLSTGVPLVALGTAAGVLWRNRRRPAYRAGLFAFGYFVALLFPVLGFFTVYYFRYSFVADHFQYLASIGPLALLAAGLTHALRAVPAALGWVRQALPLALLGGLAALSWQQAGMYRNSTVLYRTLLAANPGCWLAHNNLARILTERGDTDAAIEHCRISLRLHPSAVAHFNLGLALMTQGSADGALSEYHAALALDPTMTEAYSNVGVLLASLGRPDAAAESYRRAAQIDPKSATVQGNWGLLLAHEGDFAGAIEHYRAALRLDSTAADTYDELGVALVQLHRWDEALANFQQAITLAPMSFSPHHHAGQVLALQGKAAEAVGAYAAALELRPTSAEAHVHLGAALQQLGRRDEAATEFKAALQLDPALPEARQRLEALGAATSISTPSP